MLRVRRTRLRPLVLNCEVAVEITSGALDERQLANWLREAIANHHRFRAGHVGLDIHATITKPMLRTRGVRSG